MPWSGTDDGAMTNPRVMRLALGGYMKAELGYGDPDAQKNLAWGVISLCASWSGRHFTDLHFPEYLWRQAAGIHADWIAKAAQNAKLFGKKMVRGKDGDLGWQVIDNGDQLIHVLTWEEHQANKHRNAARRNGMQVAVRLRDGDQCRWCGKAVRYRARSGWMRGTYLPGRRAHDEAHMEHPDPKQHDNLVVSCGQCDDDKGMLTPEEWWGRFSLRDVPEEPIYGEDTIALFSRHGITQRCCARVSRLEGLCKTCRESLHRERAMVLKRLGDGSGAAHQEGTSKPAAPNRGMSFLVGEGSGRSPEQERLGEAQAGSGEGRVGSQASPVEGSPGTAQGTGDTA